MCKRTQQLPTLLGVVAPADVGCCWQWCANGCKNFASSRPSRPHKLTVFARISAKGIFSVSLASLSFSFGVGARLFVVVSWWCYCFFPRHYNDDVALKVLIRTKIQHVDVEYYDAQLCISLEAICNVCAWPQQCWMSCANGATLLCYALVVTEQKKCGELLAQ